MRRAHRQFLAALLAIVALGLPLATGALSSPLLVLPMMGLFLLPAVAPARVVNRAVAIAVITLGGAEVIQGGGGWPEIAAGLILAGAGLAGGAVATRRDRDLRRLGAQLDAIHLEARRGRAETGDVGAARRLDAIRERLADLAAMAAAHRAVLWLVDRNERTVLMRAVSRGVITGGRLPLAGTPLNWLVEAGHAIRFEARPPITTERAQVLAVPVAAPAEDQIVTLEFLHPAVAPEAERLAPAIAEFNRAMAAIQEQASHAAYRERVAILVETLRRIPAAPGPEEFARDLAAGACRLTGASGAVLATWADDNGRILAVHGADGPPAGATFDATESELALAARAATLLRRDLRERRIGPPHLAAPGESWTRPPRHFIALPLLVDDRVCGLLAVWSSDELQEQGIELLETLAPFAGAQLDKALEFGRVRASAERDSLTGLPNRRAFERAFEAERQRFLRYAHPLALLVVDIDHFKLINDTHGHDAGDAVLRAVAQRLHEGVRDVDTVARFGGEEFVILLPETRLEAAAEVAERLRASIEALDVRYSGITIPVRASFGASACPDCVAQPQELLRSGDASLYAAKRAGRNCVEIAPRHATGARPGTGGRG